MLREKRMTIEIVPDGDAMGRIAAGNALSRRRQRYDPAATPWLASGLPITLLIGSRPM